MAVKIDMKKAYNRLRCEFIRDTLENANFPSKVVRLIMNCVTTVSMQML